MMAQQDTIRLLVVGGNGFIGRHIVTHAQRLGWQVTTLGLSSASSLVVDITDHDALQKILGNTRFEYVVNCGGYIDHTLFFKGGKKVFDVHFSGVVNLVEALDRDTLRIFVNMGSSDEYGGAPAPQAETQRELPISPYSLGKTAATHFLQMLHRTEKFPATTLRLFLTYGPGQETRRFLPQIIQGCLEDKSFPTSAGEQLRDFCFVQDVVEAVFAALHTPAAQGEVINIASGQAVSIRHMIEMVCRLIGKGRPRFGEVAYRAGENMALYADVSKAKRILQWQPQISLETGLHQTVQSIRDQL